MEETKKLTQAKTNLKLVLESLQEIDKEEKQEVDLKKIIERLDNIEATLKEIKKAII